MKQLIALVSALAVGLAASPVLAVAPLTQAEAAGLAADASPSVRALARALDAAQARAMAAGAWPNPSVVSQVQLSTNPSNNMLTLGFRQPLDFRHLADQRRAHAQEDVEALRLQLERARRNVRYDAVSAYDALWLAQAILAQHDHLLGFLEGEYARNRKRVDAGAMAAHDLVHVEFELAQARLKRQSAQHDVERARARLNLLLGRAIDAPVTLPPVSTAMPALAPLPTWVAEAVAHRTEIGEAEVAVRREDRAARLAESLRFGEGEIDLEGGTAAVTDPMFYGAFGMPVPLWNTSAHDVAAARAESARYEATRAVIVQQVTQEVADAYLAVQHAAETYRSAVEVLGALADHDLERAEARVKAGVGVPTEIVQARQQQLEAASTRLKALLEYHLAYARLEQAAGR